MSCGRDDAFACTCRLGFKITEPGKAAASPKAVDGSACESGAEGSAASAAEKKRPGRSLAGRTSSVAGMEDEKNLLTIYKMLGQLQSYVWLNLQAFSKIMKKYDKVYFTKRTECCG